MVVEKEKEEARVRAAVVWGRLGVECVRGHSESESLGGGGRKETRKKYDSTIPCTWGELSTA